MLLDVRGEELYNDGHIEGAISLPHARINEKSFAEYSPDTLWVVYGAVQTATRLRRPRFA